MGFLGIDIAGAERLAGIVAGWGPATDGIASLVIEAEALCDLSTHTIGRIDDLGADGRMMATAVRTAAAALESFTLQVHSPFAVSRALAAVHSFNGADNDTELDRRVAALRELVEEATSSDEDTSHVMAALFGLREAPDPRHRDVTAIVDARSELIRLNELASAGGISDNDPRIDAADSALRTAVGSHGVDDSTIAAIVARLAADPALEVRTALAVGLTGHEPATVQTAHEHDLDYDTAHGVVQLARLDEISASLRHMNSPHAIDAAVRERQRIVSTLVGADHGDFTRLVLAQLDTGIPAGDAFASVDQAIADERRSAAAHQLRVEQIEELAERIATTPPFERDHLLAERDLLLRAVVGNRADAVGAALSAGAPNVAEALRTVRVVEAIGGSTPAEVARFERSVVRLASDAAGRESALDLVAHATAYGIDPIDLAAAMHRARTHLGSPAGPVDGLRLIAAEFAEAIEDESTYSAGRAGERFSPRAAAVRLHELLDEQPEFGAIVAFELLGRRDRIEAELLRIGATKTAAHQLFAHGPLPSGVDVSGLAGTLWEGHHELRYKTERQGRRTHVTDEVIGRDIDSVALAFRLDEIRKLDPVLAGAVKAELDAMLTAAERLALNEHLTGGGSWMDRVTLIDDAPGEFFQGAGKEFVNGLSSVVELGANHGNPVTSPINLIAALQGRESPFTVDIPEFELENLAERGGANAMVAAEIAALPVGLAKSGPGLASRALTRLDEIVAAARAVRVAEVADPVASVARLDVIADATSSPAVPSPRFHSDGSVGPLAPGGRPVPGTLTLEEIAEIQALADRFGTQIDVVGSRAAGRGRNIDQPDLPEGKGPGTRSDIDFRYDTLHPDAIEIEVELNQISGGAGNAAPKHSNNPAHPPNGRDSEEPMIIFESGA